MSPAVSAHAGTQSRLCIRLRDYDDRQDRSGAGRGPWLRTPRSPYLPTQPCHRVYRDTFRLLFTFAQARLRKPPSALAIADAGLPLRSCGLSKKASPSAGRRHALWETQYSPIAQHRDRHEARAALVRPRRCRHCNQQTPPCQPSPLTARKNRNRHIVCPLICKSVGK